jgi:hypothetical protein
MAVGVLDVPLVVGGLAAPLGGVEDLPEDLDRQARASRDLREAQRRLAREDLADPLEGLVRLLRGVHRLPLGGDVCLPGCCGALGRRRRLTHLRVAVLGERFAFPVAHALRSFAYDPVADDRACGGPLGASTQKGPLPWSTSTTGPSSSRAVRAASAGSWPGLRHAGRDLRHLGPRRGSGRRDRRGARAGHRPHAPRVPLRRERPRGCTRRRTASAPRSGTSTSS